MPRVGFEPMTPVLERAKTVHALDREATVIGPGKDYWPTFLPLQIEYLTRQVGNSFIVYAQVSQYNNNINSIFRVPECTETI
jgi:hypothetical protein